jgi:DNA-binding CsgD family transcriptional regulator
VQRTGLRPGGTGRVCWQWFWFAMESPPSALPLTPTVRQADLFICRRKSTMSSNHHSLTKREVEILVLLTQGKRNCEIANILCISENTLETHLKHIFKKMNASNRVQAVMLFKNIDNKNNGIP